MFKLHKNVEKIFWGQIWKYPLRILHILGSGVTISKSVPKIFFSHFYEV